MVLSKKRRIYSLKKTLKVESIEAVAMLHYYNPIGKGDWFVTHVEESKDGLIYFGLVYIETFYWAEFKEEDLRGMKLAFNYKIKYNATFSPIKISFLIKSIRNGEDFRL